MKEWIVSSSSDKSPVRRKEITNAALACFVRVGYNKTTMDAIATECGVSEGTLYWYFKSKDNLLESALSAFIVDLHSKQAIEELAELPTAADKWRALAGAMAGLGEWADGFFNLVLGVLGVDSTPQGSCQFLG